MVRLSRVLLVLGVLAGACCAPRAFGQVAPVASEPLPVVPDIPRSLYAPPPRGADATPLAPPPVCLESGHYFEADPQLDTPELPLPGPFVNVALVNTFAAIRKQGINGPVNINGASQRVSVPEASLNFTVSPRVELGYRLPSGFGELLVAYRSLATNGSNFGIGPDGPALLSSKLNIQTFDFDYASRELCLRPCWDMRWWVGIRTAFVYFSNESLESLPVAATGFGGFAQQTTDLWQGVGPHVGLELDRRLNWQGLSLTARGDVYYGLGRVHNGIFAEVQNPDGTLSFGQNRFGASQSPIVLSSQFGLRWEPPQLPHSFFFLGYDYEYWWYIGTRGNQDPTISSNGEISAQGIWLRAEFNY